MKKQFSIYYTFVYTISVLLVYLIRYSQIPSDTPLMSIIPRELGILRDKYCIGIDPKDPIVPDDSNVANSFRNDFYKTMRQKENKLIPALDDNNWSDYIISFIPPTIIWGIFFVFSIVGWISYCFCSIFDKQCPPSRCCRRNYAKRPCKGFELWGPIVFTLIFGVGILGISIAGLIYSTKLEKGTKNVVCQISAIFDDALYGTTYNETQWIGIYSAADKVNSIVKELSVFNNKNLYNKDTSWIDTELYGLIGSNNEIYEKYRYQKIVSPNSETGGTVGSNFFVNNLGPLVLNTSLTGSINIALTNITLKYAFLLKQMQTSSLFISDNAIDYSTILRDSTNYIRTISDSLTEIQSQVSSILDKVNQIIEPMDYGFYGAWSLSIFSIIIGMFGSVAVYFLKWRRLRFLLHCSWFLLGSLMCIGFLMSSIMMPLTIFSIEFCEMFDFILNDSTKYDKYDYLIPSEINPRLKTCIFGDGNMLQEFGINDQISELDQLGSAYYELKDISNSNINYSEIIIKQWSEYILNISNGVQTDAYDTSNNNAENALNYLNRYTDYTIKDSFQTGCQATADEWVFNQTKCKGTTLWINDNKSPTELKGVNVCIGLYNFGFDMANNRYNTMGTCDKEIGPNAIKNFKSIKNYDDSRRITFNSLYKELYSLSIDNSDYNKRLVEFNNTLFSGIGAWLNFIDLVSNPNSGIVTGLNCKFIKNNAQQTHDSLCLGLFVPIYLEVIFIITTSLLTFFTSFLTFLAAMRFGRSNDGRTLVETWNPDEQ